MEASFDWYASVARRYRYLAEHDSPQAAAIISEIQSIFGRHAAMRAGVTIALTKTAFQQHGKQPDISIYRLMLEDHLEAIPLLELAVAFCLPQWGIIGGGLTPTPEGMQSAPKGIGFLTNIAYTNKL